MAKESGIGMTVTVDNSSGSGQALTNDITNLSWQMPSELQDATGLDKSAHERFYLLGDLSVTLNGVFNDASNLSYQVLKNYRTISVAGEGRTTAILHSGQSLSHELMYTGFDFTRGASGELTWTAPAQLMDGTLPAWTTP